MMKPLVRSGALLPRTWFEAVSRALGANRLLANPDHIARAEYEARVAGMVTSARAQDAATEGDDQPRIRAV